MTPTLIIEVLSPSTEAFDRGEKAEQYRQIPSLREHVLISQDRRRVEQYVRAEGDIWTFREYGKAHKTVDFPSLGCSLSLAEIYADVDLVQP